MFENCKYKWDYIPSKDKETGYENILEQLQIIDPAEFERLSEEDQDELVDVILKTIRSKNIFPIYYYSKGGIIKEIRKVIEKDIAFEGDCLVTQASQGLLLLDYMFPNLHRVKSCNGNGTMYDRFYDDIKLSKCIKRYMKNYPFENVRTMFFMYARFFWNSATNFSPIRAKAIYERFVKPGGVIYDFSCGFGGRMLGALSSKNNYIYIGCEPCTDTHENLNQLGKYIEMVTHRKDSYYIYKSCSEDKELKPLSVDFTFSCPPFFKLEEYSDEATQSTIRHSEYDDWLEHYVKPTFINCYKALKDDGLMGVDVYNFFYKAKKYHIVEDFKRIAKEVGFEYVKGYPIISRNRKSYEDDDNIEQVHIFRKLL